MRLKRLWQKETTNMNLRSSRCHRILTRWSNPARIILALSIRKRWITRGWNTSTWRRPYRTRQPRSAPFSTRKTRCGSSRGTILSRNSIPAPPRGLKYPLRWLKSWKAPKGLQNYFSVEIFASNIQIYLYRLTIDNCNDTILPYKRAYPRIFSMEYVSYMLIIMHIFLYISHTPYH